MIKAEYTVSILDSKWNPIKRNINILFIPRKNEYIYMDNQYYEILNIIHMIDEKQDIFIIVDELSNQGKIENPDFQLLKK